MADYREAPLATRPKTLDPAEYFNLSLDQRRAEEERAGLRAQLKRQYQMQLNNPHRKELIVSTEWANMLTLASLLMSDPQFTSVMLTFGSQQAFASQTENPTRQANVVPAFGIWAIQQMPFYVYLRN